VRARARVRVWVSRDFSHARRLRSGKTLGFQSLFSFLLPIRPGLSTAVTRSQAKACPHTHTHTHTHTYCRPLASSVCFNLPAVKAGSLVLLDVYWTRPQLQAWKLLLKSFLCGETRKWSEFCVFLFQRVRLLSGVQMDNLLTHTHTHTHTHAE